MIEAFYNAVRKDAAPQIIEVNGRQYSDKSLYAVHTPNPDAIHVKTLTSIVDYLKTNIDGLAVNSLICHVESPSTVSMLVLPASKMPCCRTP